MEKQVATRVFFNWCHQESISEIEKANLLPMSTETFRMKMTSTLLSKAVRIAMYGALLCFLKQSNQISCVLPFCALFHQGFQEITTNLLHNSLHCVFAHVQASKVIHNKNLQVSFISQFFYIKFSKPLRVKSIHNI